MPFEGMTAREQYLLVVFYRLVNSYAEKLEQLQRLFFIPENIAMVAIIHLRSCGDCQALMARYQLSETAEANQPPELSPEDEARVEKQIARFQEERQIEEMAGPDHILTQIDVVEFKCGKLRAALSQCELFLRHLKG